MIQMMFIAWTHSFMFFVLSQYAYFDHLKVSVSFGERATNITTKAVRHTRKLMMKIDSTSIRPDDTSIAIHRISIRGDME